MTPTPLLRRWGWIVFSTWPEGLGTDLSTFSSNRLLVFWLSFCFLRAAGVCFWKKASTSSLNVFFRKYIKRRQDALRLAQWIRGSKMASTVSCVGLSMLTDLGLVLFSRGRKKKVRERAVRWDFVVLLRSLRKCSSCNVLLISVYKYWVANGSLHSELLPDLQGRL